jgi:hypothetical protein
MKRLRRVKAGSTGNGLRYDGERADDKCGGGCCWDESEFETELFIGIAQFTTTTALGEHMDAVFWRVVESEREMVCWLR